MEVKTECESSLVNRPWGYYKILRKSKGFKVKSINVYPNEKLSVQMHHHRDERWVVVSGTAKVLKGDFEKYLSVGETIEIPAAIKHSLENPGFIDLQIIEIQFGNYLEEDDIVRFDDRYGRVEVNC